MRKSIFIAAFYLVVTVVHAAPVLTDPSLKIELLTHIEGSALHSMDISDDGRLFVSSYNDGKIFVISSPSAPGIQAAFEYASGFSYASGLTFTDDNRLFVKSGQSVYQVFNDGTSSLFSTGHSYPISLASYNNDLYISNSGDGTIEKIDGITASVSTIVSGLSAPNGPFGLSMDNAGMLYFTNHATGAIFSSDLTGNLNLLGSLTPFGVGYTGISSTGELYVSDILTRKAYKIDSDGNMSVFASGFAGKSNPPFNGPHDYVFDSKGNLYISDASSIWRVSAISIPAVAISIDIKPGSETNSINLSSAGVIPVAIISTNDFDALSVIPETISLSGSSVKMAGKSDKYLCHEEDVNVDGLIDLVCQVYTAQFFVEEGEVTATAILEAETTDGTNVRGEDYVRIVPYY